MSKHTPGPWFANGEFIGTIESDSQTVAYVSSHRNRKLRPLDEEAANARLIAAGPELLEALRALVDRDFTYFDGAVIGAATKITRDEVLAARAAIAKATQP